MAASQTEFTFSMELQRVLLQQDLAVAQTRSIVASMVDKTDHLAKISAADVDEIDESA